MSFSDSGKNTLVTEAVQAPQLAAEAVSIERDETPSNSSPVEEGKEEEKGKVLPLLVRTQKSGKTHQNLMVAHRKLEMHDKMYIVLLKK